MSYRSRPNLSRRLLAARLYAEGVTYEAIGRVLDEDPFHIYNWLAHPRPGRQLKKKRRGLAGTPQSYFERERYGDP